MSTHSLFAHAKSWLRPCQKGRGRGRGRGRGGCRAEQSRDQMSEAGLGWSNPVPEIVHLPTRNPIRPGCLESGIQGGGCVVLEVAVKDPTFDLANAVCSHGLFMMAPNRWDPSTRTLCRPLRLLSDSNVAPTVRISQPASSCPMLLVTVLGLTFLSSEDKRALIAQVRRMLRISDKNDQAIREFHKLHPASMERGFGRVFRSPTLFEDMVKCILLCNCQWPRTLSMARALCELQQELKCRSNAKNFHAKTPQPREPKRKRGSKEKIVMKLETKFMEDEAETGSDTNSVVSFDAEPIHPGEKLFTSALSCIGDPHNSSELSQLTNSNTTSTSDTLCPSDQIGDFPTPEELATLDAGFLANRCRLGYRAQRILSLAQSVVEGKIQMRKLEEASDAFISTSYEEMDKHLSCISGFGPFTRANVLMCMGFYHRIPADTETIRHLKQCHARRNCTILSLQDDVDAIYGKYAPFQFLVYWSEIWNDYEKRFGNLSEMAPSDYQLITASNMRSKISKRRL